MFVGTEMRILGARVRSVQFQVATRELLDRHGISGEEGWWTCAIALEHSGDMFAVAAGLTPHEAFSEALTEAGSHVNRALLVKTLATWFRAPYVAVWGPPDGPMIGGDE
jgi:hypothetical protein